MKKKYKITILLFISSLVIVFIGLRLSTAIPGLKATANDLLDMLIYKRNYTYDQKIEILWKNDYRYSEIVKKILGNNETVNFSIADFGNVLHPDIIANFIYPIRVTNFTKTNDSTFEAIFPGCQYTIEDACVQVYVFNIDKLNYSTIGCNDFFMQQDNYKDAMGLIKK